METDRIGGKLERVGSREELRVDYRGNGNTSNPTHPQDGQWCGQNGDGGRSVRTGIVGGGGSRWYTIGGKVRSIKIRVDKQNKII